MKLLHSLNYALAGIFIFFRHERNGQLQAGIAITAVILGTSLQISYMEWVAVLVCIIIVLVLEMINTTIEKMCDIVQPNYHPQVKIIKDIAAGAVLLSAIGSSIIGVIIFLPKIILLFKTSA